MRSSYKVLYSFTILLIFANPAACFKAMNGCGPEAAKTADDVAKGADNARFKKSPKQVAQENAAAEAAARESLINEQAQKTKDEARSKSFKKNSNNDFSYDNKQYKKFEEIPFESTDNLIFENAPTREEIDYLIKRGVKFIFSNKAYQKQKDKRFRIIYLTSTDVNRVKELYEIDEDHAKVLIKYSSVLNTNYAIFKVGSYEDMLAKQNEVISMGEIPILIFHNSVKQRQIDKFNLEANFITCNSFEINPETYLTSIDLLDMRALISAVNSSYSTSTLEEFYKSFAPAYHSHMSTYHQQNSLIYVGGLLGVGGGVYAIAYYNKKQ